MVDSVVCHPTHTPPPPISPFPARSSRWVHLCWERRRVTCWSLNWDGQQETELHFLHESPSRRLSWEQDQIILVIAKMHSNTQVLSDHVLTGLFSHCQRQFSEGSQPHILFHALLPGQMYCCKCLWGCMVKWMRGLMSEEEERWWSF